MNNQDADFIRYGSRYICDRLVERYRRFDSKFSWPSGSIASVAIQMEKSIELVEAWNAASIETQISAVVNCDAWKPDEIKAYLAILPMFNNSRVIPNLDKDFTNLTEFRDVVQELVTPNYCHEVIDSTFVRVFLDGLGLATLLSVLPGSVTVIALMHSVFGGNLMMEFCTIARGTPTQVTLEQAILILKDWENLKNYPIDWTLNLINESSSLAGVSEG